MKTSILWSTWPLFLWVLSCPVWQPSVFAAMPHAKLKVAVLEKVPKAQSAKRFDYLYPQLTEHFQERFANDDRFQLLPPEQVKETLAQERIDLAELAPDDTEKLREIGKLLGADAVFSSYYYEMGGHAMPMHSNNVLMLIWVNREETVNLDRAYSKVLSEEELISSDALALDDLLENVGVPPAD